MYNGIVKVVTLYHVILNNVLGLALSCVLFLLLGHYIYIEASSPRVKGDIARLSSDRFKVSTGFNWCLRFWYHMYGNSVGSLSVKIRVYSFNPSRPYYRTLWTQQLNHGDVWLSDQVQINSPNNFEVWLFLTNLNINLCRHWGPEGETSLGPQLSDSEFNPPATLIEKQLIDFVTVFQYPGWFWCSPSPSLLKLVTALS